MTDEPEYSFESGIFIEGIDASLESMHIARSCRSSGYVTEHRFNDLYPAFMESDLGAILFEGCVPYALLSGGRRVYRIADIDIALSNWFRRSIGGET